jgi:hypothetical protein
MKNTSLLLCIMLMIISLFSSCGPSCKECRMNGPMGVSMSLGELCDDDLKKAETTEGVTCD